MPQQFACKENLRGKFQKFFYAVRDGVSYALFFFFCLIFSFETNLSKFKKKGSIHSEKMQRCRVVVNLLNGRKKIARIE